MADTFTLFSSLPTELRLQIFDAALPEYFRTIHLRKYKSLQHPHRTISYCMATTPCPFTIVALLKTCHEARFAVTRRFQSMLKLRVLNSRTHRVNSPVPQKFPLDRLHYFDPQRDGVFVDSIWPWSGTINKPAGLFNARILNIHCNDWWTAWNKPGGQNILLGKDGLLRFRSLEKLNIVFRIRSKDELSPFVGMHRQQDELAWPSYGVNIDTYIIQDKLEAIKAAEDPDWKVPEVKCSCWAAGPPPKAEDSTSSGTH